MNMRLRIILLLSWLGLLGERLWNRFWPAASLCLFFSGIALLNVPSLFGGLWHLSLLAIFVAALIAALVWRPAAPFSFPSRAESERCVEKASALPHRPLQTLHDTPAEGLSENALLLWRRHIAEAERLLPLARLYKPQTNAARHDPWRLRFVAFAVFILGLAVARNAAPARLHLALAPDLSVLAGKDHIALDLWIVPPDYTHEATIFPAKISGPARVPAGSLLKLRLSGLRAAPWVRYAGQSLALAEAAPGSFTLETPLNASGELIVRRWFSTLGRWRIDVLPDTAPVISILNAGETPGAAIKITYRAEDDHGIARIMGTVRSEQPELAPVHFDIPSPAPGENSHVEDLTALPWAGSPATLTLEAVDSTGQTGASAPYTFNLPERIFTNPLATAIIAERKSLLRGRNILIRRVVAQNLAAMAQDPSLYRGDLLVFMSLSTAARRLALDASDAASDSVQALLWDVALKLEDGGLSQAQQELRDALQKLSETARDKNASPQQLQEALDEVRNKMRQYVQTLAQEMQQRQGPARAMPALSPELAQRLMKNIDLSDLLERMRRLSQADARDGLQKMAQRLRDALDNIDPKKMDEMREKQAQAMEALQNLENIVRRQQSLLDKTGKSDDAATLKDLQREQSALRDALGESLRKLGTSFPIPENFTRADQAMKLAAEALGRGQHGESIPHQKTALEELQKGEEDAAEKMAQALSQSILSFGPSPGGGGSFDPLGRPLTVTDDDSVKIPSEKEIRRVQEIIRELRQRSGETGRSKTEHDYIDRLLEQF